MSKRIGIFLLAIITMIGALPIEVIAAGMDDRAANLVGDTTGSLVESNDQQYSEEKNKNSETEIILESAKETAEENNKSKTVKNIQEKENIGEVNTQAETQPMIFDMQKIQNQPQGDILREIIKNNNYGLDWNNIENYVGKEPTIEENLIEGSTNYIETPEVIGNTTLTNKIEAIINKDETGKAESITWVYKTKAEGEALEQTNSYITIRDAGLNYPLIETRKFDTTEGENTYNPYTNITYRDIQNQIQRITTGNISSPIQETSEVNSLVPNKVTQTIVKTPILAQQNSYTLTIRTETKIGREIKNSYKTFTINTDNTITYNAVQTNGVQKENTINWLKTVVNTTDETQNFTIDLTPDNSQKVLNTIQVKKYKLTEKGYEEVLAEKEVKEIESLSEESAKINQVQKVEKEIESKNEMTTFGMFKLAQKTVEEEKITQENKTTEQPEINQSQEIAQPEEQQTKSKEQTETTEEVPQIVKTAPTATASTALAASIAAEGLEAENAVPERQETETTTEENSAPKVEDTTETNAEPKEKVVPNTETISTIPTDVIVERLNRAEELKENFKSNTVETIELAPGEIAIAELSTEIIDPKAEHTVPDGKVYKRTNLLFPGEDYEDLRRRTVPEGDLKLARSRTDSGYEYTVDTDRTQVGDSERFQVSIEFNSSRGHLPKGGDEFTIPIDSNSIKISKDGIVEPLFDKSGKQLGQATIYNDKIVFKMYDTVNGLEKVEGGLKFWISGSYTGGRDKPGEGSIEIGGKKVIVNYYPGGSTTNNVYRKTGVLDDRPGYEGIVHWGFVINEAQRETAAVNYTIRDTLNDKMDWAIDKINEDKIVKINTKDDLTKYYLMLLFNGKGNIQKQELDGQVYYDLNKAEAEEFLGVKIEINGNSLTITSSKNGYYFINNGSWQPLLNKTTLQITLPAKIKEQYLNDKETHYVENTSEVDISNKADWKVEEKDKSYRVQLFKSESWIKGIQPKELKILKVAKGTGDINPETIEGVTFELKSKEGYSLNSVEIEKGTKVDYTETSSIIIKTDENGLIYLKKLPTGEYTLKEVEAPEGVVIDSQERIFKAEENSKGQTYKIENEIKRIDIKVEKEWKDLEGTHPEVKFKLLRKTEGSDDSEFREVTTEEEPSYSQLTLLSEQKEVTWKGLRAYDKKNHKKYIYKVEEVGDETNKEEPGSDENLENKDIEVYEEGIVNISGVRYKSTIEPKETWIEKLLDIDNNTLTFKVTNEKQDNGKGKFTLKKTDENQEFLKGSVFTLTKKENEKLPESFVDREIKIDKSDGVLVDNLEPGIYTLEEKISPAGYKSNDDYIVIVHQSGNTQVIEKKIFDQLDRSILKEETDPEELFNINNNSVDMSRPAKLLQNLEVYDYELVSSNSKDPGIVRPNYGEYLITRFKIKIPAEAKEGDYFYTTFDERLNRLGNKLFEGNIQPIKSYTGEELIRISNKNGDNTYKYILTEKVNNKQDFEIELELPLYVNRKVVKENSTLDIVNTIPSTGKDTEEAKQAEAKAQISRKIRVDYSGFSQKANNGDDYVGSAIYYNPTTSTAESYIYLYGFKEAGDKISSNIYSRFQGLKSSMNLFSEDLSIEVYKVKNPFEKIEGTEYKLSNENMPESFGIDSNWIESKLKSGDIIKLSENRLDLSFTKEYQYSNYGYRWHLDINDDTNNDRVEAYGYIVKVNSKYDQYSDNPLRIVAGLRKSNYYNYTKSNVAFDNEIINASPSATIKSTNSIKLLKVDEIGKKIPNTIFKLTSVKGEEVYSQYGKTDEKGQIIFGKIKAGDYNLEEIVTAHGYEKPSSGWKISVVKDGKTGVITSVQSTPQLKIDNNTEGGIYEIIVTNKKSDHNNTSRTVINYPNKIIFYKVGEEGMPIIGAQFKLLRNNDSSYVQERIIGEDNKIGEISFEKLLPGDYTLYETKVPEGYPSVANGGKVASFTVASNGKITEVKTLGESGKIEDSKGTHIIVNKISEIKLKIEKRDGVDNNLLGGAKFELYVEDSGERKQITIQRVVKNDKLGEKANYETEQFEWETQLIEGDGKGTVIIEGLLDGVYWLKETKAPEGYVAYGEFIGPIKIQGGKVNVPIEQKEPLMLKIENNNSENPVNVATVTNRKPVYPSTGGMGTVPFVGAGVSLMALAWYELRKRKYDNKGGGTN